MTPIDILPDLIRCTPLIVTKRRRGSLYCHRHGTVIARFRYARGFHLHGWLHSVAIHSWNVHVARMRKLHRRRPVRTTRMPC